MRDGGGLSAVPALTATDLSGPGIAKKMIAGIQSGVMVVPPRWFDYNICQIPLLKTAGMLMATSPHSEKARERPV